MSSIACAFQTIQTPPVEEWTGRLRSVTPVPKAIVWWTTMAARQWNAFSSGGFVRPDLVAGSIVAEVKLSRDVSLSSIPRSSCEPIARWEASSLHDLAADEGFQQLVRECFGGPARVKRSTPNPEEPGEPELEFLMLAATLPPAEANEKLFELFKEIEEHGSQVLRDAVISLEHPA
jgi:hypothetical protein